MDAEERVLAKCLADDTSDFYDSIAHKINADDFYLFKHNLVYTSPWFIDCLVENRGELMNFLKNEGVGTRVMYPPINKQKIYYEDKNMKVSDLIGQKGLWLPSASQLTNDEIKKVCKAIKNFYS